MKFYAEIYKSNTEFFKSYHAYEIVQRKVDTRNCWYLDSESFYDIQTDTLREMEKRIREMDCECKIVAIPDSILFFQQLGNVYCFNRNMVDLERENPFDRCVEGLPIVYWDMDMDMVKAMKVRCLREGDEYPTNSMFNDFRYASKMRNTMRQIDYNTYFKEKNKNKLVVMKRYKKAELTVDEYNSVFKAITDLLDEYDFIWTEEGVNKVIDTWLEEKGELITAFREHPNYNGNFQLVFSDQFYRLDTDTNSGARFINWVDGVFLKSDLLVPNVIEGHTFREWEEIRKMYNRRLPNLHPMVTDGSVQFFNMDLYKDLIMKREMANVIMNCFKSEWTEESKKEYNRCRRIFDVIYEYPYDRVNEYLAEQMNAYFPEFKVREGQKTTKVFGRVMRHYGIDKIEGFTKKWAEYCDGINVIDITRHTVMSVHPADFLTQSFGNSWSSCHTIDKRNKRRSNGDTYQGMHCSGTMSYLLDSSSFVLYTVDKNYKGNTFYEMPKINRCMFHVMNERIQQGRCYPQKEDGNEGLYTQFRTLVQKVMSEIWDIPNTWVIKRGSSMRDIISTEGTQYPDYNHFDNCNMSIYKHTEIDNEYGVMKIGHMPICVECGEEHDVQDNLNCCGNARWICPECGAVVERDDDYTEIDGERYHDDCVFYCAYHDRYEPNSDRYGYVKRYGDICDDAYEYSDRFVLCDHCGDTYFIEDMFTTEDGFICNDCVDNYVYIDSLGYWVPLDEVTLCENCDEYFIAEDAEVNENGHFVCPHCGVVVGETEVA